MRKVLKQIGKVSLLIIAMMIINPHRLLLLLADIFAAGGSWIAWKLEDFCQWIGGKVKKYQKTFPLFGKKLGDRLEVESAELDRLVKEADKKYGK